MKYQMPYRYYYMPMTKQEADRRTEKKLMAVVPIGIPH
jgi:hypothetical protein